MMKLMKYELLRRKQLLIGAALSMLFVEGVVLLGIYMGRRIYDGEGYTTWESGNVIAIVLTVLLIVGGFVLAFLDGVTKLYSDFKHKHGYMIFMTPQNGYRVIWAKTVFAVLEMLAAVLAIAGCVTATGIMADHFNGGVISGFLVPLSTNMGILIGSAGLWLLQVMVYLSIAILAVTVSRAMTRSGSYNWLIALVMYFALAFIVNMADSLLLLAFGVIGDVTRITNDTAVLQSGVLVKYFVIGAVTYSAWFTGCTLLSGRLVNRGIDL